MYFVRIIIVYKYVKSMIKKKDIKIMIIIITNKKAHKKRDDAKNMYKSDRKKILFIKKHNPR
jgi:hypothetical protein